VKSAARDGAMLRRVARKDGREVDENVFAGGRAIGTFDLELDEQEVEARRSGELVTRLCSDLREPLVMKLAGWRIDVINR